MWNTLPRAGKIASYIAAITGAIIGVGTAWTMLDLPVVATRGYVNEKELRANEARSEIIFTVLDLARDHRERIRRGREGLMARLAAATDPQVRADLQLLIDVAAQDVADVESRIGVLERMRAR